MTIPGRRIRLRRDATGAPSSGRNGGAVKAASLRAILAQSAKSREREGSALALKKAIYLIGFRCHAVTAAVLVRQLLGPHLSTWPWCSRRSSMALTAATSASSFPQSSTGRLDVSSVLARS